MAIGDIYPAGLAHATGSKNADVAVTIPAPGAGLSNYICGIYTDYGDDKILDSSSREITDCGHDYTSAPTVGITGDGWGGAITAAITKGQLASPTVTVPGRDYTSAPTVAVSGDGHGGTVTATITKKQVSSVTVTARGKGYKATDTFGISSATGTAAAGTASFTMGELSVSVTSGGSLYAPADTIAFDAPTLPHGVQATGTLVLDGGAITGVTMDESGCGYTGSPGYTITTSTGSGAVLRTNVDSTSGKVYDVTMTNVGHSYDAATGAMTTSTGSGATFTCNLDATKGQVTALTLSSTDKGYGYTAATLGFSGGAGTAADGTIGVDATKGAVTGLTVTEAGHEYTTATLGLTSGGGAGATATIGVTAAGTGTAELAVGEDIMWMNQVATTGNWQFKRAIEAGENQPATATLTAGGTGTIGTVAVHYFVASATQQERLHETAPSIRR